MCPENDAIHEVENILETVNIDDYYLLVSYLNQYALKAEAKLCPRSFDEKGKIDQSIKKQSYKFLKQYCPFFVHGKIKDFESDPDQITIAPDNKLSTAFNRHAQEKHCTNITRLFTPLSTWEGRWKECVEKAKSLIEKKSDPALVWRVVQRVPYPPHLKTLMNRFYQEIKEELLLDAAAELLVFCSLYLIAFQAQEKYFASEEIKDYKPQYTRQCTDFEFVLLILTATLLYPTALFDKAVGSPFKGNEGLQKLYEDFIIYQKTNSIPVWFPSRGMRQSPSGIHGVIRKQCQEDWEKLYGRGGRTFTTMLLPAMENAQSFVFNEFLQLVNDNQILILHGGGGVGKSTLMSWLASRELMNTDPFFVYFRATTLNEFPKYEIQRTLERIVLSYYGLDENLAAELSTTNVVYLIDGLNEVKADYISSVFEAIRKTNKRVVITCRNPAFLSFQASNVRLIKLNLSEEQKKNYLIQAGLVEGQIDALRQNSDLWFSITPFFLTLNKQRKIDFSKITNAADFLYQYYHNRSLETVQADERLLPVLLKALLPSVCYHMCQEGRLSIFAGTFVSYMNKLICFLNKRNEDPISWMCTYGINYVEDSLNQLTGDRILEILQREDIVDLRGANVYIHELKRDYFAAYYQFRLSKLLTSDLTGLKQDQLEENLRGEFYQLKITIHQMSQEVQSLFCSIRSNEKFDRLPDMGTLIAMAQATSLEALRYERWKLAYSQIHILPTTGEKTALNNEALLCLQEICSSEFVWNEFSLLDVCELVRYYRDGKGKTQPDLQKAMEVAHDACKKATDHRIIPVLNQLAKNVLKEYEYKANGTDYNPSTKEQYTELITFLANPIPGQETNKALNDQRENSQTLLKQIVSLWGGATEKRLLAGRSLLRLSIAMGNAESMNLEAFLLSMDEEYAPKKQRDAFLLYHLSALIPHPSVQMYSIRKKAEVLIDNNFLLVGDALPSSAEAVIQYLNEDQEKQDKYFLQRENIESEELTNLEELTNQFLINAAATLSACNDPFADQIFGRVFERKACLVCELERQKEYWEKAKDHYRKVYDARPMQYDCMLDYYFALTMVKPFTDGEDARFGEFKAKVEKLRPKLVAAYSASRSIVSIDRWFPTTRYVAALKKKEKDLIDYHIKQGYHSIKTVLEKLFSEISMGENHYEQRNNPKHR